MPRLSKARFVRLEYNWKKSIVSDETFDFRGEPTLLKMENGGGKSVLTQMMLSAYLDGRKRNFHSRPFNEYFSGPKPTFLLQEWIKDGNVGRFCVGQMIRKAQSARDQENGEESEETRLDYVVWIAEYADSDDVTSLSRMVLTEQQTNGRRSFMSYASARSQLDTFAREYPHTFRIYNMNDSSQRKAYHERLENLGIRLSEMRQLREFNQEESGISKFNGTYNTEDKLIRKVFIPAIMQRLDAQAGTDEKNGHVEMFRESFASLLEEKRRNRENLILVDVLSDLMKDLEEIETLSSHRNEEKRRLDALLMDLRLLYEGIQQAAAAFGLQEQDLEGYWNECQQELIRITHQILSIQFHENHKHLVETLLALESLMEQQENTRKSLDDLEKERNLLECAAILSSVHQAEDEERSAREKMEAAKLSSAETARKQEHIGAALYDLYCQDLEMISDGLEEQLDLQDEKQSELSTLEQEIKDAQDDRDELISTQSSLNTRMNTYQEEEKKFVSRNGLNITHSLSYWEDHKVYEKLDSSLSLQKEEAEALVDRLQEEIAHGRIRQEEASQKSNDLSLTLASLKHQIADGQKQRLDLEARRARRENMLKMLGLPKEDLWNNRAIEQAEKQNTERIRLSIQSVSGQISNLERKIRQYNTGALELSEDIRSVMEELGIEEKTGADLLRNWKLSAKKKEKLIAQHPFLPYSLIMDDDQIEAFIRALQEKEINTSMPIPLQSRDSLNQPESLMASPRFYLQFNTQLIYAEELEKLKKQAQDELEAWKAELAQRQSELELLQSAWTRMQDQPVSEKEFINLEKSIATLEKKKGQTQDELSRQALIKEKERKHENEISSRKKEASVAAEKARNLYRQFHELSEKYKEAAQCWYELTEIEEQLEDLQMKLQDLENQKSRLNSTLHQLERQIEQTESRKEETEQLCTSFSRFKEKEPADGTKSDLEAAYESLQMELNQSQAGIFAGQMEQAQKRKEKERKRLNGMIKELKLSLDEVGQTIYSDSAASANRKQISQARSLQEQLNRQIITRTKEQGQYETEENNLRKQMLEKTGQSQPLELSQISSISLEQEKAAVEEEAERTSKNLEALRSRHNDFNQAAIRLQDYEGLKEVILAGQENVPNVENLSLSELETRMNDLITSWKRQKSLLDSSSRTLKNTLEEDIRKYQKKNELAEKALSAILARIDDLPGTEEEIAQKKKLTESFLASIQTNLEKLQNKKDEVFQNLFGYIRSMDEQMKKIDQDTTVQIGQKHRKMLEIMIPDWSSHEAMYREKLRQYIDDGLERLEKSASDEDSQIYTLIAPASLYHNVVGINTIRIRLFKIEELSQSRIDWYQAGKLSGAEGFLCALTVILAVLNYQHRTNADLLTGQRSSSLLLLDNPFAYTQSAHIIDTMMKLASNMNTQIVAFTNVDNAAVLNAFPNIYSLRMIPRYDGRNYLNVTSMTEPEIREAESVQLFVQ